MALVEPIVGHLLSQYAETRNEGFEKIRNIANSDVDFAVLFISHPQAVQAMKGCLQKSEFTVNVLETLCTLIECSEKPPGPQSHVTRGQQRGARLNLIREFCSGDSFAVLKKALSALSDATLPVAMAALKFLGQAATYAPKMLLARFNNKLPLHLACFRAQLPYSQRRIRLSRLTFLLKLAESKHNARSADIMCAHGFLTSLFEDAAEVLQDGSQAGLDAGKAALRLFQDDFIVSQTIPATQKRGVLMSQRNIFRLLVKALEVPQVSGNVAEVMYHMVTQLVESPSDYASSRVEAADGRGMPNFPIFFLLRQLRPNASSLASRIVLFILNTVPDLIRPYFARISGHLADEGNLHQRVAPSTARIATLNTMTRVFMAPLPYHLVSRRARLEPVAAKASSFYTLSPRDVADEICPQWVAEYVHRVINGSSNLMTLTLALQLTEAALARAKVVLALVADIQRAQQAATKAGANGEANGARAAAAAAARALDADDMALFTSEDALEESEDFDARVQAHLLTAIPRREEFWHRMTQQLHPMLTELYKRSRAGGDEPAGTTKMQAKTEFVYQRMLLLMQGYTDVFHLRVSWLSATPTVLPTFPHGDRSASASSSSVIGRAMLEGNDALCRLSPQSISALCDLLVAGLSRGVSMPKLHHITMSNAKGGITEWPLLLSLLLWAVEHRRRGVEPAVQEATAWVARVVQWVVHGVTVRHGCEYAEALLWVLSLTEEAIPCFLHVLNNLLQRSLSKAADRVTQELIGGDGSDKGLLLAASESFVAKTEEKAATGAEKKGPAAAPAGKGGRRAGGGGGAAPMEMWVDHLRACLPVYKKVMEMVSAGWAKRSETASAKILAPLRTAQKSAADTCGRARIFDTAACITEQSTRAEDGAAAQQRRQALHHSLTAKLPAHEQLRVFCTTLADPLALSGDAGARMTVEETALVAELNGHKSIAAKTKTKLLSQLAGGPAALAPSVWCTMRSLCWGVAGALLHELDDATTTTTAARDDKEAAAQLTALYDFASQLLHALAKAEGGLTTALVEMNDTDSLPFFVLLLALLRVGLVATQALTTINGGTPPSKGLEASLAQSLERVVLAAYGGTLSAPDRVRYAIVLSLHYVQKVTDAVSKATGKRGARNEEEQEESSNSDDSGDDESDNGSDDAEDEKDAATTAKGGASNAAAKRPASAAARVASARFCTRAVVPCGFQANRYLISQHEPVVYITPESDMLAYVVGSLTENEIQRLALGCPARLHNSLRCLGRRRSAAVGDGNAMDLLLSIFPEVSSARDLGVVSLAAAAATAIVDPRFLVPLLHTVGALPGAKFRYLASRCTPLLVRALSFTEVGLRRFAMSALFAVAHVPQQRYATPEGASTHAGSSSRRIIASFARLKMVQLTERDRRRKKRGPGDKGASFVPRLPGPLSAFLVLALDTISAFDDKLHNHFVSFLNDPKTAFTTAVPFVSWLSSFPIDAVSTHMMLKQQEEVQRTSSMITTSIAQTSAEEAMADLRRNMPPHLTFMADLVQHACGTTGDAVALVRSEAMDRLMLLCDLVTASPELRQEFLRCLATVCGSSFTVAALLALRKDTRGGGAGLLPWVLAFLAELNREYAADVMMYSEALYTDTLRLLRLLCGVVATAALGSGRGPSATVQQYYAPVAAQLRVARDHLLHVRVTAKETLDLVEECLGQWGRMDVGRAASPAGEKRLRAPESDATDVKKPVAKAPKREAKAPKKSK